MGMVASPLYEAPITIAAASFLSFVFTFALTPYFIRFFRATGIVGRDIMKRDRPLVADTGGPGVITGLLTGIFFYISMRVFALGGASELMFTELIHLLASISTILIITLIGFFDVLTSLMEQKEGPGMFERMKRKGIPGWVYYLVPLPAAIPLAAVNAGVSSIVVPFFGRVRLGVLYPLAIVPIAVLCCSNATNFLAGFNGLETGMGFVLHVSLGLFAFVHREYAAALLAFTFASALLAFLRYNWYPAEIFPGDLNYTIGAVCVCVAVIGNMERFAILCFTPWVIEAFLKALSGFKAESYGILQEDGTVKPRTNRINSLTHLAMSLAGFKEYQVSSILIAVEAVICAISFFLVRYI